MKDWVLEFVCGLMGHKYDVPAEGFYDEIRCLRCGFEPLVVAKVRAAQQVYADPVLDGLARKQAAQRAAREEE